MFESFVFRRPQLADAFVQRLVGPLGQGKPLLLYGPRRIGKTTFLRNDLLPALAERGILPLYVNLWSNRTADPAALLERAIEDATRPGWMGRTLARVRKVGAAGIHAEIAPMDAARGETIAGLEALVRHAKRPVALIIDEAQQALATPEGATFMYALKTAWEVVNQGTAAHKDGPRLVIVMTGSARDKLARLAVPKGSPFFGAAIPEEFPALPDEFARAYATYANQRLTVALRLDAEATVNAFDRLGRRAEHLFRLVAQAVDRMTGDVEAVCASMLADLAREADRDFRTTLEGLTDLQIAVLRRIGAGKPLFSREALDYYSRAVGETTTANEAQTAALQLRAQGLVWNAARGVYEIEDDAFADWLRAHPKRK